MLMHRSGSFPSLIKRRHEKVGDDFFLPLSLGFALMNASYLTCVHSLALVARRDNQTLREERRRLNAGSATLKQLVCPRYC